MPHSIGRLSASALSHHDLSLVAFITNIAESDFRYTQLLNDLENVGFTFGGQFAGHGVYVIGAGRFVLTEYTLQ